VYHIRTAFNKLGKLVPLVSFVYDDQKDKKYLLDLYLPGTGQKLCDVEQNKKFIKSLFNDDVSVNDFKSHINAFNLSLDSEYSVYDIPTANFNASIDKHTLYKSIISEFMRSHQYGYQRWNKLIAEAILVYVTLERRGVLFESMQIHPIYEVSTFTGRSKSLEFNIQGIGDNSDIQSINSTCDHFICADWLAADMRMTSILSKDEIMGHSFEESDPYLFASQKLNISRDEIKKKLLSSIYSINTDSDIFEVYPTTKNWINTKYNELLINKHLSSVLGRKFDLDGDNQLSVFNAMIQGSVVHAMQNSLVRLFEIIPEYILTELHDSIIMACPQDTIKTVISEVVNIMRHPFNGILSTNPKFPVSISVGNKWREWKLLKVYR